MLGKLKLILNKKLSNKSFLFLLVGGYNTIFGYLLANLFLYLLEKRYAAIALIVSYLIQLVHNFFMFEKFVFKSNISIVKGLIKLNNSYICMMILQFILVSFLIYVIHINSNIAYNIIFPILVVGQYFLHNKYTFK